MTPYRTAWYPQIPPASLSLHPRAVPKMILAHLSNLTSFAVQLDSFNFFHQKRPHFDSFIKGIIYFFRCRIHTRITEFYSKIGNPFNKRLDFLKIRIVFFTVDDQRRQVMDLSYLFILFDEIRFQPFLNCLLTMKTSLVLKSILLRQGLSCNEIALPFLNPLSHYLAHRSPARPSIFS